MDRLERTLCALMAPFMARAMRRANQADLRRLKALLEGGGRGRGEYLEMEWWLPPSTETPPKHIHPHQREDYEVLEGAFEVFVRDGWRTVAAGESASAPVGEVHTFRVGDRAVRVRNVHAPALDFEDYFAAESALMEAGRIRSYSSPRAVLHYAVLLDQYRDCMVMASPLLRGLITALGPLGRRLGFGRP